jgi:transposase, IS605 OrfB family, central region
VTDDKSLAKAQRKLSKAQRKLSKAQRKLSKAEKGTVSRKKALKMIQYIHERVSNKREDFIQKISLNLVKVYDVITFEDLNVKDMVKNHNLAKHIVNIAWNKLITYYILQGRMGW